jgi:hypothetical protein
MAGAYLQNTATQSGQVVHSRLKRLVARPDDVAFVFSDRNAGALPFTIA